MLNLRSFPFGKTLVALAALTLSPFVASLDAQSTNPSFARPAHPTGQLARQRVIGGALKKTQPVEWKLPKGVRVAVAQPGEYWEAPEKTNLFGLQFGSVYRFRIDQIPAYPDVELYPTVELLGVLNPPAGRQWDFPVEFEIPAEDLALAARGSFVTRVVFVENSANAMNVDASESNRELVLDVPQTVDPVVAASTRGRPLAIIRIGARAPLADPAQDDPFFFGLPPVEFKPVSAEVSAVVEPQESEDLTFPEEAVDAQEPKEDAQVVAPVETVESGSEENK
ncbi:MAG: hypothetical protein ACI4NV_01980 [Thermoguttaceae bacterium]